MISSLALSLLALFGGATALDQDATARYAVRVSTAAKQDAEAIGPDLRAGVERIERFFGDPFAKPFVVEVFAHRSEFDAFVRERGWMERTERWMVAAGVADRLVILGPSAWKAEADEHDPSDREHVRNLVAHELVHVYHGQRCPKPDFDGMDDMGWLTEGLAVLVSGQLEREHRGRDREAIRAGKAPARLGDAWSGRYRYAVSGSIVAFVERKYGRKTLNRLLTVARNEDALTILGTTERRLLDGWAERVTKGD